MIKTPVNLWIAGLIILALCFAYQVAVSLAVVAQELSEEDRGNLIDTARELTDCAGFFYATEDLAASLGDVAADERQFARQLGHGAVTAAAWLFFTLEVMGFQEANEYVKGNAASARGNWRVMLKDQGNPAIAAQRQRCAEINPIQAEAVRQAMRWALQNQPRPPRGESE